MKFLLSAFCCLLFLTGCQIAKRAEPVPSRQKAEPPPLPKTISAARLAHASAVAAVAEVAPPAQPSLFVPGTVGFNYTIQSSAILPAAWSDEFTFAGTGPTNVVLPNPGTPGAKFWRWRQVPAGDLWFALDEAATFDACEAVCRDGSDIVMVGTEAGANFTIYKFSSSGERFWKQHFGGTIVPKAVAVDSSHNILVTGYYVGGQSVGGPLLPGSLSKEYCFVAKYNSSGVHQWSIGFGNPLGNSDGYGIAVDAAGKVYVSGKRATDSLTGGMAFVRCYSSTGIEQWDKSFNSYSSANSLGIDGVGNLFLTGWFFHTLDLGGTVLMTPNYAGWIARLGPTATHVWSRAFGSFANNDYHYGGNALAVAGNDVCLTGTYIGSLNLGGSTFTANPSSFFDVFFARYSQDGNHQWSSVLTSTSTSTGWGITAVADSTGMLFGGRFYGTAQFGNGVTATSTGINTFAAKYSPLGVCQWARGFEGNNEAHATAMPSIVGGWFTGTMAGHASAGGQDAYLIQLQ